MSDELWRAVGQGGPTLVVLVLVLWGGYRLAARVIERTLATLDVIAARVAETSAVAARIESKIDAVAQDIATEVREPTGRHKRIQ